MEDATCKWFGGHIVYESFGVCEGYYCKTEEERSYYGGKKCPSVVVDGTDFRDTDLSHTTGIDSSISDIRGSRAMAILNSSEIFTGKQLVLNRLEKVGRNELVTITSECPYSFFISSLEDDEKNNLIGKKAWILSGKYHGSFSFDVINTDPNVVIIMDDFSSHGYVKTVGDVIIIGKRRMNSNSVSARNYYRFD